MSERNPGLIADPLFVGATRPPMRWGVTYSALLFNMVSTMEVFLLTKNLLGPVALRADPRCLHAAVCAGCALLRSRAALGENPVARAVRQSAGVEGEQLLPAGPGSAKSPRPPARGLRASCAGSSSGRLIMLARMRATAMRREHSARHAAGESWRSRSLISGKRAWLVSSPAKWPGTAWLNSRF